MKATIDVPDPLYRQVKAKAAIEGRTVREISIELFEAWLADEPATVVDPREAVSAWVRSWGVLADRVAASTVDSRRIRDILAADRR